MTSRVRSWTADAVEEDLAVAGDGGVEGGWVDGFDFFLVVVEGGDLFLDVGGGVVLELGVVLVEADGGADGGGEVEVDVGEVLVGDEVEGLEGAVGGDALRLGSGGERERSEEGGCGEIFRRMWSVGSVRRGSGRLEAASRFGVMGLQGGVIEVVGVLAVGNDDVHFAGEASELAGAGVGDYGDAELRDASVHGGAVLQDEGAGAAFENAGDEFEGDVTAGGAFDTERRGEHGAFAGGFEVAVELLVEEHASDGRGAGIFVGGLGGYLYFKGAGGVERQDCFFFCGAGGVDPVWALAEMARDDARQAAVIQVHKRIGAEVEARGHIFICRMGRG